MFAILLQKAVTLWQKYGFLLAMKKNVSHFVQNSLRWLGISASLLCAVHCAAMPIMFMVVATHQVQHQHSNPWLEAGVLLFSFLVAVPIVYNNYRQHKHPLPLSLLVLGLVSMTVALFFDAHWLSAVGGLLLAVAQLLNWHFYRKVKICCTHA